MQRGRGKNSEEQMTICFVERTVLCYVSFFSTEKLECVFVLAKYPERCRQFLPTRRETQVHAVKETCVIVGDLYGAVT